MFVRREGNEQMDLTKQFTPEQYARALESWAWLGLDGRAPLLATLFGDILLGSDKGIWFLDTLEGSLTLRWDAPEALGAELDTEAGRDRYLLEGLAMAAHGNGKVLGPDQVYDIVPPPILGGTFDVDHVVVSDFVVTVNIAGQLHQQLRNLAPGTRISGFTIAEP